MSISSRQKKINVNLPVRTFNSEFFNDPAKKGVGKKKRRNPVSGQKRLYHSVVHRAAFPEFWGEEISEAVIQESCFW